jgi:hypothetical protein
MVILGDAQFRTRSSSSNTVAYAPCCMIHYRSRIGSVFACTECQVPLFQEHDRVCFIKLACFFAQGERRIQNADYMAAGATVVPVDGAFGSDIVLKVRPPDAAMEVSRFKKGGNLISYIQPAVNKDIVDNLQAKKMTVIGALCRAQRLQMYDLFV